MKHKLSVDSVYHSYGKTEALKGAYFQLRTGEIVGMLGRNGSGKSTLLKYAYGGLGKQDAGTFFDDVRINHPFKRTDLIRYLPQFNFVPKHMTLNKLFSSFGTDTEMLYEWFPDFRMLNGQKLRTMSGGEIRIIEVMLILTSGSRFILLDEPFAQISPIHIAVIKEIIRKIAANGHGIILTDHYYKEILDISDRLYVINEGRTIIAKDADDLKRLNYTI